MWLQNVVDVRLVTESFPLCTVLDIVLLSIMRPNMRKIPCAMMSLVRQNYCHHYIAVKQLSSSWFCLEVWDQEMSWYTEKMKCQTLWKYFLFLPWFDDRDKDHSLSNQNYVKVQDGTWKLSGYTFSICQRWNVGTIPGYLQGEIIKDQPILWRLDQT